MNEQTIEMYRAVQNQWKTVEVGDRVYTEKYGHGVVTNNKFNDPCFREDIEIRWDNGKYGYWCSDDPDLLWLPPPTPRWPGDDNRNLWDMVDWKKWYIHVNDNNLVAMYLKDIGGGIAFIEAPTLPEVLLVALQWEGNYDEVTK